MWFFLKPETRVDFLKKLLMVYFCKKLAFGRNAEHSVEAYAIIKNTSDG